MKKYLNRVKCLIKKFKEASFLQIPREENMEADVLAKEASADGLMDELDEVQYMPSIDLLEIIKTWLEGTNGVWLNKLPGVLWAYRTTVRTPIGETLFKLAYGSEAVIPAEVNMANHRVMKYQDKENKGQLRLNIDLIDEVRMDAE
nr:uncharacterized protein LOC112000167 [Quercus suber]